MAMASQNDSNCSGNSRAEVRNRTSDTAQTSELAASATPGNHAAAVQNAGTTRSDPTKEKQSVNGKEEKAGSNVQRDANDEKPLSHDGDGVPLAEYDQHGILFNAKLTNIEQSKFGEEDVYILHFKLNFVKPFKDHHQIRGAKLGMKV